MLTGTDNGSNNNDPGRGNGNGQVPRYAGGPGGFYGQAAQAANGPMVPQPNDPLQVHQGFVAPKDADKIV